MNELQTLTSYIEEQVSGHAFPATPAQLYDPLRYFMTLGGKRMRPVLTIIGGQLFGVSKEESIHAALAIEFFHNFSLIHDDIMDAAPVRRGKPTVHTKWNPNIAILSGDVLFTEAYKQLAHYKDDRLSELLTRFNETATGVCEGQQMDMDFETMSTVSKEQYIEMIRLKTSVLVGCAFEFGAILGRADAATRRLVYDFGVELGIAFQIQDDILDLYADPEKFGKQVGGDILSNKKTLLLLTAMELAQEKGDQRVDQLLSMSDPTEKVAAAQALFHELKATEATRLIQDAHYRKALQSLEAIPIENSRKEPLRRLAEFLMNREL